MSSAVIEVDETSFASLHAAVDDLLTHDRTRISDDDLLDGLRELQRLQNRLAAVEHALISDIDSRGVAAGHMCADTTALIAGVLRLNKREATARVAAAFAAGPRRGLTGEPLGPVFPHVADAQADGSVSPALAAMVVRTVDRLPGPVAAVDGDAIERTLVDAARTLDTRELGLVCERLKLTVDPDGVLHDHEYRNRHRDLRLTRRPDGSATLTGELTVEASEKLATVLDTLARPKPETDGTKDQRSAGQRNHDALVDVCDRLLRSDTLPESGGVTATVVITMTDEAWRTGQGIATTGRGALLPAAEAIDLAGGDARMLCIATNSMRQITGYGQLHRFFTETQRLAIAARDGGCSFPGCETPAARCQTDHLVEWQNGGKTAVSNGHLLCGFHHRAKNTHGWHPEMINGRPAWKPPPRIDPKQTHRVNRTHRPGSDLRPTDDHGHVRSCRELVQRAVTRPSDGTRRTRLRRCLRLVQRHSPATASTAVCSTATAARSVALLACTSSAPTATSPSP